jgi:hypothetical protein
MKKVKSKKVGFIVAGVIIVVAALVAFTPEGQASFAKLIDLFASEKPVEIEIEGKSETGNYEIHTHEVSTPKPTENGGKPVDNPQKGVSYVMYVDKSTYDIKSTNGIDTIVPVYTLEDMPEIS